MAATQKILFIRLKSLGDILLTLPAVHLVRANFPQARLTFFVSKEYATLMRGFSEIQDVLLLDRAPFHRKNLKAMCVETIALAKRLRQEKFSLVVDFQGFGETALFTWLTRSPQRWGSVYGRGRAWAFTRTTVWNHHIHPVEQNLSVLTQCGLRSVPLLNRFDLPEEEVLSARVFLARHAIDPARPILYIQPFTSLPSRNWPMEQYLALARFWSQRGVQVVFSGGPEDHAGLEPARAAGFLAAAGLPRLTDAGLMSLSTLIVGGNTGFLHLAVAMGKRVLMLLKPTGPGSANVPFGHPDWVVVPPGESPMTGIDLDTVIAASASGLSAGSTAANESWQPTDKTAIPPGNEDERIATKRR